MARFWYNFLMLGGLLICFPLVLPFLVLSPKRRKTVLKRLFAPDTHGMNSFPENNRSSNVLWVHALSVGEMISAIPLVLELERIFGKDNIVLSASTLTGFETAISRLVNRVGHIFFFPYDLLYSVNRAINQVDPALVIIVETDLWPNFMAGLKTRGIPALLVTARLSDRSARGYQRVPGLIGALLNTFAAICVQSAEDARRFVALGASEKRVITTGNMKFDQPVNALDAAETDALRQSFGLHPDDRILVAGSTHAGEEEILASAFKSIRLDSAGFKMIVAPRDPGRARAVVDMFQGHGLQAVCLAQAAPADNAQPVDVVVIDRIGVLSRAYALGELAYIGGSLVNAGGHNPLEAAARGKPIVFGPDMSDFKTVARLLVEAGGAVQVMDADSLKPALARLLNEMDVARRAGQQARRVFIENSGAVDRTTRQVLRIAGGADA